MGKMPRKRTAPLMGITSGHTKSKLHGLGKVSMCSMAGAGVGGTPRGRSSTCEQRDKRPTLTYQNKFPLGPNNADNFLLKTCTSACSEGPAGTLTEP